MVEVEQDQPAATNIAVEELFTEDGLIRALKRIASAADGDSLVDHPLRRLVLTEFRDVLAKNISRDVISGRWSPHHAYVCTVRKGRHGFRELVFPCLEDSVVARCIIDALESAITCDDDGRTFCGRSHANTNREPGDYERWFEVWQDFTAAIAAACEQHGYAYVFTTDVTDFFPSVRRDLAKKELARRTPASPELLELLFYAIETWLPRVRFSPMTGLPIDDIDVSRLVSHNFLKQVDERILGAGPNNFEYLRFVDDAVFLSPTKRDAARHRRSHHLALRAVGLNPSASKSDILSVDKFQSERHRDFNLRIYSAEDADALRALAGEWHEDLDRTSWQRVCLRLYARATKLGFDCLSEFVAGDLANASDPRLVRYIFRYLTQIHRPTSQDFVQEVVGLAMKNDTGADTAIYASGYLAHACFEPTFSETVSNLAYGNITAPSETPGYGYAQALLLLALFKHGTAASRERVRAWVQQDPHGRLNDERFRLCYLYVMQCCNDLTQDDLRSVAGATSPDIDLTQRLVHGATTGNLRHTKQLLGKMPTKVGNVRTLVPSAFPLLRALADNKTQHDVVMPWLDRWLPPSRKALQEATALDHVIRCKDRYTQ